MYLVIRKQEELSGLGGAGTANRGALWPVPGEDEFGELSMEDAGLERHRGSRPAGRAAGRRGAHGAGPGGARACPAPDRRRTGGGGRPGLSTAPSRTAERSGARSPRPPRPTVLQAAADAIREGVPGVVADDPPEAHYARGGLPVPRTGPDLQPGDDREIDTSESLWMQAMRAGDRPDDPWSEAVLAMDEEIKARYADSPDGPAGEPGDEPAGGDPAREAAAEAPADDAMHDPEDEPPAAPEDDWFAAAQAEIRTMDRPPLQPSSRPGGAHGET